MARISKVQSVTAGLLCWIMTVNAQSNTTIMIPDGKRPVRAATAGDNVPAAGSPAATRAIARPGDKVVVIKGTVNGDTKGNNQIYYYTDAAERDSSAIVNGQFTIILPFDGLTKVLFFTQYEIVETGRYAPFPLLVDEPGLINITMNIQEGFRAGQISGLGTTVAYNSFMKEHQKTIMEIFKTMNQKGGAQAGPPTDAQRAEFEATIRKATNEVVTRFVKENSNSFVAAYVISENKSLLKENVKPLYDLLSFRMRNSETGKDLLAFYKSYDNKILDGDQVKDFSLPDEKGKEFNFSQLKGKYVWLDFWASWCQPCKIAFPSMRKVYEKYKGKDFEILAISIDKDKQAWLKAVKATNNPWLQIWDNTSIASQFSVTSVPNSFLIGPDGKIIMSEVGFNPEEKSKIEQKLDELIGGK